MAVYSRKNRTTKTKRSKRSKLSKRTNGGGFSTGSALSSQAYYVPEYVSTNDCAQTPRPGAIMSNPNPNLTQIQMAGGGSAKAMNNCKALAPIGSIQSNPRPNLAQTATVGGRSRRSKRGGCGCRAMKGGRTKRNKQRGGRYMVNTANPIGGDGPVMVPTYSSIPCEGHRAMPINPANPTALVNMENPDINMHGIRPAFIQTGGSPTAGSHPLAYEAPRAGFSFYPNIAQGEALKPGLIPYQNVIPQAAPCTTGCGQAISAINK